MRASRSDELRNKPNSYDKLSEFSRRIIVLAALFEVPVENEQFAKVLPGIHYQIDAIRHEEYIVREKIFRGAEAAKAFNRVDTAIYHAEYILKDPDGCPERGHNLAISGELTEAAASIGNMAMEGYRRQKRLRGA